MLVVSLLSSGSCSGTVRKHRPSVLTVDGVMLRHDFIHIPDLCRALCYDGVNFGLCNTAEHFRWIDFDAQGACISMEKGDVLCSMKSVLYLVPRLEDACSSPRLFLDLDLQ